MTTAHRPTWKAAVGQGSGGGWTAGGAPSAGLSVLDMPGHTKLKIRTGPQVVDRQKALKESLRKLQEVEKEATKRIIYQRPPIDEAVEEEGRLKLLKQTAEVDEGAIRAKYDDEDASDDDDDNENNSGGGWSDVDKQADEDDLDASSDDDEDDDDDDDEDDDENEEAALQAELAKIRAEREAMKRKEEEEAAAEEEEKMEEAALLGNPLLATGGGGDPSSGSGRLKRRWNEDVVFRNQAKGGPETKKRFINDTVRNDFHKRFLNKFIR